MKYLLLLCFLYCGNVKSQSNYSINYRQVIYYENRESSKINGRLVYNDSLSFFYLIPLNKKKDKLAKFSILGDKLIHHGVMYDKKKNEILNEVTFHENNYFVIVDSPKRAGWVLTEQSKNILGYACKLAYRIDEGNDTTMVWYTGEVGTGFGPSYYFGLPGIVLEALDQRFNLLIVAKKIEPTSVTLVLPQNVERIPIDKYRKQKVATINEKN